MHGCRAALAGTAVALALAAAAGAPPEAAGATPQPSPARTTPAQIEKALLREMNRVRAAHGRPRLRARGHLRRPARAHSRFMRRFGDLRHEGRDGSPFWTRLVAAGFPRNRRMGENLAMVSGCSRSGARRTVRMWMNSPGHRANLLDRRFRWVGAGVAIDAGCSATWLTADYGG